MRTYDSPEDFVEELTSEKGLPPLPPPTLIQTGMVDPKESTAELIRFAPGTRGSDWVMVPVSIIDKVEYLGNRPCSQGECPYVRLHLKGPGDDKGDAIFQALAGILRQPGTAPGPSAAGRTMTLPAGPSQPGPGPSAAGRTMTLPAGPSQPGPGPSAAGRTMTLPAGPSQPGPGPSAAGRTMTLPAGP